jgi:hypothetical protein
MATMQQETWNKLDDAAQALDSALNLIGEPGKTDHDLARTICDNEWNLRLMVAFVLRESTKAASPIEQTSKPKEV